MEFADPGSYGVRDLPAGWSGVLGGSSGDDTLQGGAGNDTLDGGAGYNEAAFQGTQYDYVVARQGDGSILVTAKAGTTYSGDGADRLINIQQIRFSDATRVMDDVSNAQVPSNPVVDFGVDTSGQIFVGDQDWYQLSGGQANAPVRLVFYGNSSSMLSASTGSLTESQWPDTVASTTLDGNGALAVRVSNSSLGVNTVGAYRFAVLRELLSGDSTGQNLSVGSAYEYVDAGAGNDTVSGSTRADYLLGGLGSDTLVGGKGNDTLVGGNETYDQDVAVFAGNFSQYTVVPQSWSGNLAEDAWWVVTGPDGTDYVKGVERLRFDDLDYVIDDFEAFSGAQIASELQGALSPFRLGKLITGRLTGNSDGDWIPFDFGRGVVNDQTQLRLSINFAGSYGGPYYKSLYIVDGSENRLQFVDVASPATVLNAVDLSGGFSGTRELLIKGLKWGANEEGGPFGGDRAFLVVDASGGWDWWNPVPNEANRGSYSISISRYKAGTPSAEALTTVGTTATLDVDELAGLGGADTLTGSSRDELFDGGEGNDTIQAGAGNDLIKGGPGNDALYGGDGNDLFVVSGESTVSDSFDGGSGYDTVQVSGSVDMRGSTFKDVERLEGDFSTRVTLTAAQLSGFSDLVGVILSGSSQDLSQAGGNYLMEGSASGDVLKAGAGDNVIRPFAGANTVDGGAGSDTVRWGINEGNIASINWDLANRVSSMLSSGIRGNAVVMQGVYTDSGSSGTDTLEFKLDRDLYFNQNLDGTYWDWRSGQSSMSYTLDLTQATISGFEVIKLSTANFTSNGVTASYGPSAIYVTAKQLAGFNAVVGAPLVVQGGGTVNLAALSLTNGASVQFSGGQSWSISGTPRSDAITSFAGNDTIIGGSGNDTISAGQGIDRVDAGDGDDLILIIDKDKPADTVLGGSGTDVVRVIGGDVDLSGVTLSDVERLEINVSTLALSKAQFDRYAATLTGPGASQLILKVETGGRYVVDSNGPLVGLRGSSESDTLVGSARPDLLVGEHGNDSLDGGAGNDTLSGGAGIDTLRGGEGDDTLSDVPEDGGGVIDGGAGNDVFVADSQNPSIAGLRFTDVEKIISGSGRLLVGSNPSFGGASLQGVSHVELATSGSLAQSGMPIGWVGMLKGSAGNDTLAGGPSADTLDGALGSDSLSGGSGNDLLFGSSGADTLLGGTGNDQLDGGEGSDTAVYLGSQLGYQIAVNQNGFLTVSDTDLSKAGDEGVDQLTSIERLSFADGSISVSASLSSDMVVNTTVLNSNQGLWIRNANSARLTTGGYVTVWQGPDSQDFGIYAQRFDDKGTPIGPEIQVNKTKSGSQSFSDDEVALQAVAGLPNGGFVVVWRSDGSTDTSSWGVVAQRFDSQGLAAGAEIAVNTSTNDQQRDPSVAVLTNGRFVVVWMDNNPADSGAAKDSSDWGVYGQLFSDQGSKIGGEFLVNTNTTGSQLWPHVAPTSGGGFVVTWSDQSGGNTIKAQRFDVANDAVAKLGSEFVIGTAGSANAGSTVAIQTGGFWSVWQAYDGSERGVYLQRFNADGIAVGSPVLVNTTSVGNQDSPQIDVRNDESFVVVWSSNGQDGQGYGIYAQRFDASGGRIGGELLVNQQVEGDQRNADVVALSGGAFAVTWESSSGPSFGTILTRFFDPLSGFYRLVVSGNASNDRIEQPLASVIDGGAGNDTLIGGSSNTVYVVDSAGDVVIESPNGGLDEVQSSVSYTLGANLENLSLSGDVGIDATGNALANLLIGNSASNYMRGLGDADRLSGGGGNDTLRGGVGNDTLDGGAGLNTAVFEGSPEFFTIRIDSRGRWIVSDSITDGADAVEGGDEGVDQLSNIQIAQFVAPNGALISEVILDDYGNLPDPGQRNLAFGESVYGRINFYTDVDYFRLAANEGDVIHLSGSVTSDNVRIKFPSTERWITDQETFVWPSGGSLDFFVYGNPWGNPSPSNPSASSGYSFTLRRVATTATDAADSIIAGSGFEYIDGQGGNDTLIGSARSDLLLGGAGDDLLTGGGGNDELDGGAGSANVAVFSGARSAYETQWRSDQAGHYLSVIDRAGTDGSDKLRNIQRLQFSDQIVTIDAESNASDGASSLRLGQAIVGSLIGTSQRWNIDQDYFKVSLAGVNKDTILRLRIEASLTEASSGSLQVNFSYDNQSLRFRDANSTSTFDSFGVGANQGQTSAQGWLIKPSLLGNGSDFPGGGLAEVRLSGSAQGDLLESALKYRVTLDKVKLGTAGADSIIQPQPSDSGFASYVDGLAGDDTILGSSAAEELVGGAGADSIRGGAGNDLLVGGLGRDTLEGEDGDDLLDVSASSSPQGSMVGGPGVDTLRLASNSVLSGLSIAEIEILDAGGGQMAITPQQVRELGFSAATNLTFKLAPSLSAGGELDGTWLSGSFNLRGTNQSDVLRGNESDNVLYLRSDQADGSGLGKDTVHAGAGDDVIAWSTFEYGQWYQFFSGVDQEKRTYRIEGSFDGGNGFDRLQFQFGYDQQQRSNPYWYHPWGNTWNELSSGYWKLDLTGISLANVESLQVLGYDPSRPWAYPSEIILSAAQIQQLSSSSGLRSAVAISGGGNIDVAKLNSLGISGWRIGDGLAYAITATSSADSIDFGTGSNTIFAGAGDDEIIVDGVATVAGLIDGQTGNDVLVIRGADVDLSSITIQNVESIRVASQSLSMTQAQWEAFGSRVSTTQGTTPSFILTKSGNVELPETVISGQREFAGLTGGASDDRLIGNSKDNVLVGGSGNDYLIGNAGNDKLVSGSGVDTLLGGDGDDLIDVRGKKGNSVLDSISGGAGNDRLIVEDGQSLVGANVSGIEVILGSGQVSLTLDQLRQFKEVRGVAIELAAMQQGASLSIASTKLTEGARILLPAADNVGVGSGSGIVGTPQDDAIVGGLNDDVIWGGRGADSLSGGLGADTLVGGPGVDRLFGDAGDDVLVALSPGEIGAWGEQFEADWIDGGDGVDRLSLSFSPQYGNTGFTIAQGGVSNVERLSIFSPNQSTVSLPAKFWRDLTAVEVTIDPNRSLWDGLTLKLFGDGGSLSLGSIQTGSVIKQFDVIGALGDIDARAYSFGPPVNNRDYWNYDNFSFKVDQLRSIQLGGGDDSLVIRNDNEFTINAGLGDDRIELRSAGILRGAIDGGEGTDVLYLAPNQIYDLTALSIVRVESINLSNTTIIALDSQINGANRLAFTGNGSAFVKNAELNLIQGTDNGDSYNGSGFGKFQGGRGNDSITSVATAVYTGNVADYDRTFSNGFITIQHARGSLTDGTDTLSDVLSLQFADVTILLDDAPNNYTNYIRSVSRDSLPLAKYSENVSAKINYSGDSDVYRTTLVPRSPLSITQSATEGKDINLRFFDAKTGFQIYFKDLVYGGVYSEFHQWMNHAGGYLPLLYDKPYDGGEVLMLATANSTQPIDYVFSLAYLDDYEGSSATIGEMDPSIGLIKGYVGSNDDKDWVKVKLVAGTQYRFDLKGQDSGSGTLIDPKLELYNSNSQLLSAGFSVANEAVIGRDDAIVFQPTESGSYYLAVSDAAFGLGTWTLSQKSLDTVAGNVSSLIRAVWDSSNAFRIDGEVNTLTDRDWYKVWLEKGISYKFDVLSQSLSDPDLALRSVSGITLAFDDNGGGLSNASLSYSPSDAGWYFLDVGASGNASKGTYTLKGSTLVDDYAEGIGSTAVIMPDGSKKSGVISFDGDADWFKVGLSANITYEINLSGELSRGSFVDPLRDPLLLIRDANGGLLRSVDDFEGSLNPKAFFSPNKTGEYYLEVRSNYRYDIGAYALSVSTAPPDDATDLIGASAKPLDLGVSSSFQIGLPGDRDVFAINFVKDKVYELQVKGRSSGSFSLVDPFLRVFDDGGQLLEFDNNGGDGNDAKLFFVPPKTGNYFLEASSANDRGMGSYQILAQLRDLPADDAGNDAGTKVSLTPGTSFSGMLLTKSDQDWFAIKLDQGKDYVFRVRAASSGNGTLRDPLLEIRTSTSTSPLDVNDNQLTSNEPAIQFTPAITGTYYLVVKASDGQNDTGSYTLLTRGPDDHANGKAGSTPLTLGSVTQGALNWSEGAFGVRALNSLGLASDIDEDWFNFAATKDQVLSLMVRPSEGSLLSRPMFEVIDATNKTIVVGDGLETSDGKAVSAFKVPSTGTYWVRVIDAAGTTGGYTIAMQTGDLVDEDRSGPVALVWEASKQYSLAQSEARIAIAGDTDHFTVNLLSDHRYRIDVLALRDGVNAPLPSASMSLGWTIQGAISSVPVSVNGATANPSLFDFTVFEPSSQGILSIAIKPYEVTQTGSYKIRVIDLGVQAVDDRPDSVLTYDGVRDGVGVINESFRGSIGKADDTDLFAINLTEGNIYDLSLKGFADGLGTLSMGDLRILNVNGSLVTAGQYDAATGRTELSFSVFDSGRYYLAVSSSDIAGVTGTYVVDTRLRSTERLPADDVGDNARSGALLGFASNANGAIDYSGDRDWYKASLVAGKVYLIEALAQGSVNGGSLRDSELRLLSADGKQLLFDDDGGAGKDSRLEFVPASSSDYFIEISGAGAATGTYALRLRELYSGISDPLKSSQWYLDALGTDRLGRSYSGSGVTIGVVDAGVDSSHPDLVTQLVANLGYDAEFNTINGDPKYPPLMGVSDNHGTAVAGIIGAQENNEKGIVGVAPGAHLASTRVKWTFDQITEALEKQSSFDVSNNSWGATIPFLDSFNATSLTMAYQAIRSAVSFGREGKGTVFVFSAGNGAGYGDSSNYHNFQNAREVIAVGAVGADGRPASFSSPGANVLVASYGINLITTDRVGGYGYNAAGDYTSFSGTSAAAPTVSGVVALMLEANPNLGYRDVQQILAYASVHPETQSWKQNAANNFNLGGLHYNDLAGFGVVDAYQAVRLAKTWRQSDRVANEVADGARVLSASLEPSLNQLIPDDGVSIVTKTVTIDSSIEIEHLELGVDLKHSRLGDLIIEVTSPLGTTSVLMNRPTVSPDNPLGIKGNNFNFLAAPGTSGSNFNFLSAGTGIDGANFNFLASGADVDGANFNFLASSGGTDSGLTSHLLWDFSSVQFWGEEAKGTWTITVRDVAPGEYGVLNGLSLRVFGEPRSDNDTYVFTDEGFRSQSLRKLADERGKDVINAVSLSKDVLIDLGRQGQIASLGVTYPIESWSVIEDAIAGAGNDQILGNEADNRLEGMEGQDSLRGGLGNDTLIGGPGQDTAFYSGKKDEYVIAWNAGKRQLTVTDTKYGEGATAGSEDNEGVDVLEGVERIVFSDGEILMAATVGNKPPVASSAIFSKPITVAKGLGIDFDLPATAFADPDGDVSALRIAVESASGSQLPEWLSFDSKLNKFTGVPPPDLQGQIKLKLKAYDDYGSEASDILVLQFGDNQAPVVDPSKLLTLDEDAVRSPLGINEPIDPEGKSVSVRILEVPAKGRVLDGQNNLVQEGAVITAESLSELHFLADPDQNGSAGQLRYEAKDADNVTAESSVRVFINPINDAPRFTNKPTTAIYSFPMTTAVPLEVAQASDPETVLSQVRVVELPALGIVFSDGQAVALNQMLSLAQAQNLTFLLKENVNGPIGRLGLRATDEQNLSTVWNLAIEVQGQGGSNSGTAGPDALYGSIVADTLYGLGGDDTIAGNAGDDRLLGGTGNDLLFGGAGNDTMDGSSGNDYLDGGAGDDQMAGGPGHDTYLVDSSKDVVIEAISGGSGGKDLVLTKVFFTAPSNVEMVQAEEGFRIDLVGNELDNTLVGNALANSLSGGAGRDTLMGSGGNDTLDGGTGADRLIGGGGDDLYRVDSRSDVIIEQASEGTDTVESSVSFTLPPNVEVLILTGSDNISGGGNARDNRIVGNSGNNTLAGGAGNDTLEGGLGDDWYVLSDYQDTIVDSGGVDTIRSPLDIVLPLGIENAELVGIADATILGNGAANKLVGNLGDNVLDGGLGADTLTGGAGSDQFIITKNRAGESLDVITDFEIGIDLLVVDLASFGVNVKALGLPSSGNVSIGSFLKGAGAKALDADDYFILDTARGVLMFDADGSGSGLAIDLVKFVGSSFTGLTNLDLFVAV
ncbi:MAG: hypothetical protein EB072_00440 [Betaproteobacteria bacterium]|nr:hypothetical protein [Betaproteobacteria bacterium]